MGTNRITSQLEGTSFWSLTLVRHLMILMGGGPHSPRLNKKPVSKRQKHNNERKRKDEQNGKVNDAQASISRMTSMTP